MFDWMVHFVTDTGYVGVALLMFAENVFPPIPSELIMPLARFVAARGELSLPGAIVAGALGSIAGLHLWYELGRAIGMERLGRWADRYGRWLGLDARDVEAARAWFDRHGPFAVLLGRLVPTVRTLISVPAGVARMGRSRFLVLSAAGTLVWAGGLAIAGHLLESQYDRVVDWVNPVATAVVVTLVLFWLCRVATFTRRREARARP